MKKFPLHVFLVLSVLYLPINMAACGSGGGGNGDTTAEQTIGMGYDNTLILMSDGSLLAWGDNDFGELGTDVEGPQLTPTEVESISDLEKLAGGHSHTLGIKTDGTLWAWGRNYFGQLGTSGASGGTPTQVNTETDWDMVATGMSHTLAIKDDGSLWAWGSNANGQLGTDLAIDQLFIPSRVGTGTNWLSISTQSYSSLAIKTDGTLWAWGYNGNSECGTDNALNPIDTPTQIGTAASWASVSAGETHGFALHMDGTLWGWGNNSDNKIGVPDTSPKSSPVQVGIDTDWSTVSGGRSHSAGIKEDGSLWVWGKNDHGQLGTSLTVGHLEEPTRIGTDNDWALISAGYDFTVAVKDDGSVWAWGINTDGRVGNGTMGNKDSPTLASTVSSADWGTMEPAAGSGHGLTVKTDGTLWAWGANSSGQLGTSLGLARIIPTRVGSDTNWEAAWAGGGTSLGLKNDGTLMGWGSNRDSQLDTSGLDSPVPLVIGSFPDLENMNPGYEHILAVRSGTLWAWGNNRHGQCGTDSAISEVEAPAQIGTGDNWETVAGGYDFSLGVRTDGSLWTWGLNDYGQLGTDTALTETDTPTHIGTASDWTSVGTSYYSSYAIRDDGTLWAWGRNNSTQLGDDLLPDPSPIPSQIGTAMNWRFVTGGQYHALGIRTDNSLWGWGRNSNDILGLGPGYPVRVSPPTQIGTGTDWSYVAGEQHFTIGVKTDGTLYAWGENYFGQVPDGTACVPIPQQVY